MSYNNLWKEFSHDIYEKHMGHENVQQIEMLSWIFGERLRIVKDIHSSVLLLSV